MENGQAPETTPATDAAKSESAESMRSDIQAAKKRMRHKFGARRELKKLKSYIDPDEHVDRMLTGLYGNGTGILVLTDRRLVFIRDGHMSKRTEDFPLRNITSVAWQSGLALGTVIITAGGVRTKIKNVNTDDGKELVDLVRTRLAARASKAAAPAPVAAPAPTVGKPSLLDQLKQLGEFHEAGVLTDEEFTSKKASILAQI
jgi:hypothetical protein